MAMILAYQQLNPNKVIFLRTSLDNRWGCIEQGSSLEIIGNYFGGMSGNRNKTTIVLEMQVGTMFYSLD